MKRAEQGDIKAIDMLCKLGGFAPILKATQIVNHYHDRRGKRREDPGPPLPAAERANGHSNGNGQPGVDWQLAERIAQRLRLHQPQSDAALAEDLGVKREAVSATCKQFASRFALAGAGQGGNRWRLVRDE